MTQSGLPSVKRKRSCGWRRRRELQDRWWRVVEVLLLAVLELQLVHDARRRRNDVEASNGKPKNWWLAKARNDVLRLYEGNPNAGLAIIFR